MKSLNLYIVLLLLTGMMGCEDDPCFHGTGDVIVERRDLPDYIHKVGLYDNLNLDIFIDTVNYLEIEAGSNMIPFIESKVDGASLAITNSNTCSFMRDFDQKLKVRLHIKPDLDEMVYEASGNLFMHDTLKGTRFDYISHTGGGKVLLLLKVKFAKIFVAGGFCETTVLGTTDTARLLNAGASWFYAQHFSCIYGDLENRGSGDLLAFAKDSIHSEIEGSGNIRYFGNPQIKININTGRGQLLPASY